MIDHYTELLNTFEEITGDQWAAFFFNNAERIDTLVKIFEGYNRQVMNTQIKRIYELKRLISDITQDNYWSDIEGLELTYQHFSPPLYIRGTFNSAVGNALGTFSIYLYTPTIQAWNHYEDMLLSHYKVEEPLIIDNKTILHIVTVPGQQEEAILKALMKVYSFLSSLRSRTFSHSLTSH